jgi:hypothetical protein
MSLAQQQRFIALAIGSDGDGLQSLDDLTGAVMRVDYTQPGWYEWRVPGPAGYWLQWVIPLAPGEPLTTTGRRAPRPPVRERTREAALQAARRIDPQLLARMVQANRRFQPGFDEREMEPQESQIVPTGLDLTILYLPGASHARCAQWTDARGSTSNATW